MLFNSEASSKTAVGCLYINKPTDIDSNSRKTLTKQHCKTNNTIAYEKYKN
jgi:hypothetical protein